MSEDSIDNLPLVQGLSQAQLELLRPLFVPCEFHEGTVIFEQGDAANFIYLVLSGEAVIRYRPEDGAEIIVARVRPGGVIGWSAVIGRQHYTSAVICSSHMKTLRLRSADLQALCEQHPETGRLILSRLTDILAERFRNIRPEVLALLENNMREGNHCSKEVSHVNSSIRP
jgi:CRP/FNR family cyclic AMP-dependent transcriptional regulator